MWGDDQLLLFSPTLLSQHRPAYALTYTQVLVLPRHAIDDACESYPANAPLIRRVYVRQVFRSAARYIAHMSRLARGVGDLFAVADHLVNRKGMYQDDMKLAQKILHEIPGGTGDRGGLRDDLRRASADGTFAEALTAKRIADTLQAERDPDQPRVFGGYGMPLHKEALQGGPSREEQLQADLEARLDRLEKLLLGAVADITALRTQPAKPLVPNGRVPNGPNGRVTPSRLTPRGTSGRAVAVGPPGGQELREGPTGGPVCLRGCT